MTVAVPYGPKETRLEWNRPSASSPRPLAANENVTVELNGPLVNASDETVNGELLGGFHIWLAVAVETVPSLQWIVPVGFVMECG